LVQSPLVQSPLVQSPSAGENPREESATSRLMNTSNMMDFNWPCMRQPLPKRGPPASAARIMEVHVLARLQELLHDACVGVDVLLWRALGSRSVDAVASESISHVVANAQRNVCVAAGGRI
jgi:hypothetical protein